MALLHIKDGLQKSDVQLPCFGFDVDVITTYEFQEGTSDATATVDITLGNEPFNILWSTGETGLTANSYNVTISDSEDCITVNHC